MTGYPILQVDDCSAWTSPHMTNTWVTANWMPLMAQNTPDSEKRLGSLLWQKLPLPKFVFLSKQNTLPWYAAHQYSERRVVVVYLLSFTHSWSCREHHCTSAPHHRIVSSNCSFTEQSAEGVFTPWAKHFLFMSCKQGRRREKPGGENLGIWWQSASLSPSSRRGCGLLLQ